MQSQAQDRFPWLGLLALALCGFITILTEALPAGLLPQMAAGLSISESLAGQLVTIYAVGALVSAIPLAILTQSWPRRHLLLSLVIGFAIVNTITAISTNYILMLVARFFAGVFAGLLWAILAGYASRMVSEKLRGRAIAVAMVGTPLALSLGIPAGSLFGNVMGWRYTFGTVSLITLVLIPWILLKVPNFPGQKAEKKSAFKSTLAIIGVKPVLYLTFSFVLAHNILYTYIAPFLGGLNLGDKVDFLLLVFGGFSLVGIWLIGVTIDRRLKEMTVLSIIAFLVAAITYAFISNNLVPVAITTALWGVAFGGSATLFQTALANASGDAADVAQSMLVTAWNAAIAGGGLVGGVLLESFGVRSFPWALVALLVSSLVVVIRVNKSSASKLQASVPIQEIVQ